MQTPMPKPLPPIESLFDRFVVDSTSPTGLRYARNVHCRSRRGDVAGYRKGVYFCVKFQGRTIFAHRIVLAMRSGCDRPELEADHIDRNGSNNHPFNLRWVTSSENCVNKRNEGKYLKGVSLTKSGRYRARLKRNGKSVNIGVFSTEAEAHQAYLTATANLLE